MSSTEETNQSDPPPRKSRGVLARLLTPAVKKWLKNGVRWGIAVFGIWYVLSNMSWSDRVLIRGADGENGWPMPRPLVEHAQEDSTSFKVLAEDGKIKTYTRDELLVRVDVTTITVNEDGVDTPYHVLARKAVDGTQLLVAKPRNLWQRYRNLHPTATKFIAASQVRSDWNPTLPYPLVDEGIRSLLRRANTGYLLASIFVFPPIFVIVAYRWYLLLRALDIAVKFWQAFVLNMVGAFYNTFMLGSTGGDVLKAYYASKLTTHRTRAVMSVIIDRVIGLMALLVLGGVMATVGMFRIDPSDPAHHKCAKIATFSLIIIVGSAIALLIFYQPALRRLSGLDWIIRRLPRQRQVQHAIETMEIYRRRPILVLGALIVTLPVHSTVVLSAMLAGIAFRLPLDPIYYWVVVPVVVLSGSIPISPQGLGVMEGVAFVLIRGRGCTVQDAFTLTMSIRIVQILWNLTGGIFVLKGGYHAPTDQEQQTMGDDVSGGAGRVATPS